MEVEDAFEEETGIGVTGTGALEEEIRNALCEKINRQINSPSPTYICIISLNNK